MEAIKYIDYGQQTVEANLTFFSLFDKHICSIKIQRICFRGNISEIFPKPKRIVNQIDTFEQAEDF